MRAELEAIVDELKLLKEEGRESVYIEDDTLKGLKAAVEKAAGKREAQSPAVQTAEVEAPTAPPAPVQPEPAPRKVVKRAPAKKEFEIAPIPEPTPFELPEGSKEEKRAWLRDRVLNDPVCNAHVKPGKKVVFGVGSVDAEIFYCGEAPGADEEIQGEPFVGRAGQLLTKIVETMGLSREQVYIGNIMNWRPELPTPVGNRPPTEEEFNYCLPYLRAQLDVVQPKVIVALGATAVNGLLGPDPKRRMGSVRGKWFEFQSTPLLITYHPSYILRNGSLRSKRMIWEDMLMVMERIGLPISEKQRGFFLPKG